MLKDSSSKVFGIPIHQSRKASIQQIDDLSRDLHNEVNDYNAPTINVKIQDLQRDASQEFTLLKD